ncbi:MAG: hypothetical protein OEY86_13545, partial [Nitrospira sp.]|nr:hypothetical protein [Nitrospira sp.]
MTDLKAAQDMLAAAVAAKGTEDPEISSVKRILKLLDKTAKSNRTYGSTNPVAQKFSQQLFEELTGHLTTYVKFTFLVQLSELLFNDTVVYETESDSGGESFAFKLYADGIRELSMYQGLAYEDMMFFLDSLWGDVDSTQDDDDIVTRLWTRNLSTISLVTAEEVAKSSIDSDSAAPGSGGMNSLDSTLREMLDREHKQKGKAAGGAEDSASSATQRKRFKSSLVGYEVTDEELAGLAMEIEGERRRDSLLYIMDMLTVILASEKSPALLSKLFSVWGDILDFLFHEGRWTVLEHVVGLLHETDVVRPDLSDEHKEQVSALLDGLGHGDRLKTIETYLNHTP